MKYEREPPPPPVVSKILDLKVKITPDQSIAVKAWLDAHRVEHRLHVQELVFDGGELRLLLEARVRETVA